MTRREISAGCVVYRIGESGIEVVLTRPRGRDAWVLPKGLVEKGESSVSTAQREAHEETGLNGRIGEKIATIKYTYLAKWESPPARVFKIVTFYLMEWSGGDSAQHDWEVERVEWFPIDEAIDQATHSSEKQILRKAKTMVKV